MNETFLGWAQCEDCKNMCWPLLKSFCIWIGQCTAAASVNGIDAQFDGTRMTEQRYVLEKLLAWSYNICQPRGTLTCCTFGVQKEGVRGAISWVHNCRLFKKPSNRFPAWRNWFLGSLNVYKFGLMDWRETTGLKDWGYNIVRYRTKKSTIVLKDLKFSSNPSLPVSQHSQIIYHPYLSLNHSSLCVVGGGPDYVKAEWWVVSEVFCEYQLNMMGDKRGRNRRKR